MPARSATTPAVRPTDEKITINVGHIDLGQIDLLVNEGFFGNRSDFIRTAIRNQLGLHAEPLRQLVTRKALVLGLQSFGAAELQAAVQAGQQLDIRVLGLASIAGDVSPELARSAIASLTVMGALHASPAVKAALADRMRYP